MYDPKLTKPPQDFSKGIPKAPVTPKPADDQEIDLDTWDDMVADKFKVPKSLMKAVRGQESGGDINAKSPTGVRGRYQVTKATAQSYGLDRDDPWQQSVAAAKHLRKLFDETDGADDDEKWLGAVGKYYGGNNAVRNGELVGSSIDGVSNPAEHVRRVAQKWGEIRRSERGTQPQAQPQQPAPRGTSSADIIPPEQRLTIPEGQSLNIGTGQIGKRAPVQGAAARRPNEAVEGAQRALSPLIPDEIEQEARQIANRATISDETRGYRRTPPPMVPSASALNQHMPFKQRPRNDVRDVPMTASEQRANQAGQLIRQIEAKRDQATALFQQADRAPAVRGDGRTLTAQDKLRAQAEGELEAANRLGERVAQEFGDLVEVGFGADANRGSNRRWVYAKPKEGLTSFYTSRNAGQRAATSSREDIAREVAQQQQMRQRRNPARNSGVLGSAAYFFPEVVGEGMTGLTNTAIKGVANLGAGAVRLGERAAEKTLTGGPLSGALDLLPDSMAGPYKDYRKAVQDRVQVFGQSRQATKGAQTIGRAADTLAPISNEPTTYDPRKAEFYSRTLPQAAGSLVPLVGASLMTGGAAAAPFLAGAAMNAEQTYQETMARTGNEQLARQAADTGAAIGALEGFGLGRMLNKFGIKQALAKRALQVVEEAGQEGASQWLNNVNMRLRQIDPNRSLSPLDEEVLGNALLGAIMGGAAQVGGRMISGPEAAQGKILREGGQPVSRDAAAQEPFAPTVRQPSPQETADADIRGVVQNYVAEMSALEQQPRTPERDAQMAQMREDYRALRNYIRDPQSLSDEQLQAILGRQQAAPEVAAEPMAQETVAPGVENAPTAEVAPVEPSAPRPSGYVDVARTAQAEAADAERAGNWEAAVTRYAEQHEALKQYQRELRKTGTPEQKAEIARQISAADLSRRRAGREVLRQERIANAPTKGLPRERASTPKAAEVAPTGELLSSTVNPEGGVPKLPTQEVDFTRLAAEQSAQKPPKPAKRLLSRIAELGGIDERYAGELQDAADARRIGVIRKRAQMSPDIMARQLASEGYDVDPEDLNTLWEAARRDIVQGERPVNTAELTRRSEGTAELEQRLAEEEAAYNERQEQVSPSASQSLTWTGEKSHRKKNEDGDLVDVPFKQNEGAWRVKDDLGGEAYGNIVDGVASIIGMESVPPSKRYTNEAPGLKRRGFFRSLIKTLQANGARSIEINMQSADTQAAVRRLLQTGELINPREMRGSSLNEHPTLFDIPVGERQPFDEIVAEADAAFQPDTADLRQVREFGREPVEPGFTQEPETAPLARGRQRITPFRPPSPQQPAGAFPARPSPSPMSRPITPEGRRVQGEIEAGRGKEGEFGKLAQLLFKSTRGDIAHGQDSFFHDKDVKGAVGLTVDAEQGDTRKAIKASVAKMLGVKADEISLTQIKPETWQRWARVKRLGPEANAKLNIAIEKWKQGATNDQETATPQTTERQQPGRASELPATPREATRQQTPATQESAAIKSGDRVQWEQRGRTETAFVSRIKGDTAYVDYGTGDEVAVPVKRLRKADVSPADAVRQIKPNGGLVPMVQLKRALGADADAAILAAAERGEIALHRHNQPSAMTAEEKANAVHDAAQGDRGWYIGASVREGATFRQQEPPLKAQMRTRADVESSPAFRQWFGESKVVGEDGKPMVVYHGTFGDFDTFEQTKDIGYHFGTAKAARDRLRGLGKKMASGTRPASGAASTGAYYLSIQNPLEIRDTTGDSWQFLFADLKEKGVLNDEDWRYYNGIANKAMDQALIETEGQSDDAQAEAIQRAAVESSQEIYEDMRQMVLDAGYDGFKYTNRIEGKGSTSWIALKPEQIKSATGNKGTFSAESPKITERRGTAPPMPERYTIRQVAQNAQMRFRPAANRPGSLYLNDWGGELMNRLLDDVYGTTTTDTNFTMDVKDARNLLDHLRDMAAVDTLYSEEERANVREAADQFERAIQAAEKGGYDVAVLTRKPNEKLSQTKVKVRHEATHASQSTIASDLAALTGGTWVDSQPKAKQIRDALARRGYAPESHDFEAAAFIASGDESVFGMSVDEGAQFLASYFDEVIKRHGKNALDRFGAIAPRYQPTLERARNEAQIRQTQTQSRAALDIGEPGQTGSTGRSGRGIQAEGRFGTEETPRRPQTGLLRGIDLEKVRQRQAGGGGAMPPRPPRPPRESGEPRKEPSRRESKPEAEAPEGSLRARAFETLGSYQTAAQLGTPGFVGRNVLQHLGYAIQSGVADRVAQAIDASIATLTRGPRRVVVPGNPVSNAIEGWRAYREGVRDAWAKTRRGEALDSGQIDELKNAPTNKLARAFRTFLTVINEIPDAGNYAARYQRRMKILTATAKRNGMQITEENLVKLQKQAEIEAAHDSMRDANFVSEMLKRTKGAMNKLSEPVTGTERFGLGDFILKYTQVPGALIKRGIEYSPLGLIESAFHAGRSTMGKGGEYEAKQAIQSLSRAVSGTASTVGMGALLAAAGVLVEPEKEDYTSEELERERGVRGFSVNLSALARLGSSLLGSGEGKTAKQAGDKLVPIDWAQPWAMGASVGATLWNQKKAGKLDKTGAVGAAGKSFENMLEIMGDQSVLKNLRAYVRAMKGDTFGEQMEGAIKKFVKDVPSSFTPGVTRQVGQVIDPNVRDYRTENREGIRNAFAEGMKRAAAGAVPGLSRQFPARVSPMTGDARKTAQGEMGVAGRLLNLLSPVTVNEYKDDPLADAIIRLNEKLDKDKLSLYVRPLSERETKLEGYKEGTTQLRQREGEFARAFARDGRRLVTSSGFKAANESRQAEMLEDLISKLRQKTYKEGPIARTLAEAQRAQRLQKAQRPQ